MNTNATWMKTWISHSTFVNWIIQDISFYLSNSKMKRRLEWNKRKKNRILLDAIRYQDHFPCSASLHQYTCCLCPPTLPSSASFWSATFRKQQANKWKLTNVCIEILQAFYRIYYSFALWTLNGLHSWKRWTKKMNIKNKLIFWIMLWHRLGK